MLKTKIQELQSIIQVRRGRRLPAAGPQGAHVIILGHLGSSGRQG